MTPIPHETYEDIAEYLFTLTNFKANETLKNKLCKVLAFGQMHKDFELKDHKHVYNVYASMTEALYKPQEYNNIEPDSIGLIDVINDSENILAIYTENYIRCDDGTGDIVIFCRQGKLGEYIFDTPKVIDYQIIIQNKD